MTSRELANRTRAYAAGMSERYNKRAYRPTDRRPLSKQAISTQRSACIRGSKILVRMLSRASILFPYFSRSLRILLCRSSSPFHLFFPKIVELSGVLCYNVMKKQSVAVLQPSPSRCGGTVLVCGARALRKEISVQTKEMIIHHP